MQRENIRKVKVYAYGFDVKGFQTPAEPGDGGKVSVEWIGYRDNISLDTADGVIIPHGIFETIEYSEGLHGRYAKVKVDTDLMLQRDKELSNLTQRNAWVCFMVGEILDLVPTGSVNGTLKDIRDTDLCKKMLLRLDVNRDGVKQGLSSSQATVNEFREYVSKYGAAKTLYSYVNERRGFRILAKAGDRVVGLVSPSAIFFFLPFHTTRRDADTARSAVGLVANAIAEYVAKMAVATPDWANEIRFSAEQTLLDTQQRLQAELTSAVASQYQFTEFKRILVGTGERLKTDLIAIFRDYFGCEIDPLDEGREDFKVIDETGIVAVCEAKGTNGGIKREHINQVDSHRERNKLTEDVPGVLLINNEMKIASVSGRVSTTVPNEQIVHARNMNVLIIRTIDLLFLMRHLEARGDRCEQLSHLLAGGGGWLQANADGFGIEKGD